VLCFLYFLLPFFPILTQIDKQKTKRTLDQYKAKRNGLQLYLNLYELWIKNYGIVLKQLKVSEEIKSARQWAKKLDHKEKEIRSLAAYHLAHENSPSDSIIEKLIERITEEREASVLEVVLFGLARHLKAKHLEDLVNAQEKFAQLGHSKGDLFKGVTYNLKMMKVQLQRDAR
jgi:hypothetical protein